MPSTLQVRGMTKSFGPIRAVSDVTFELASGQVLGLIGPNGAGKSTVVNCLTGVLRPDSGEVLLDDQDIRRWAPHRITRAGLARTFQHPRAFPTMTVRENLLVAAEHGRSDREATAADAAGRTGLAARLDRRAVDLSLSERRRLEIARVLATGASLVLLDEVMAGLGEHEIEELIALVDVLVREGLGVLLVEHLVWVVSRLSHRIVVLDQGSVLTQGEPRAVLTDPVVVEAYLGQALA